MSRPTELDQAVDRTEGVQPGRRLFHAGSGVLIAALVHFGVAGSTLMMGLIGTALVVALLLDWFRLRSPDLNVRFFKAFRFLASPRERDRIASSTWYLVGILSTLLLAPEHYAVSAILVLALADPAASVTGRLWGRRRIGSGTLLGTSVFLATALTVLALRHPVALAVPAAVIVSAVEILKVPIDDNLRVPLATALGLMGLGVWLG